MKAVQRNRDIYALTGIVVTGLPERYVECHPEKLEVRLGDKVSPYLQEPGESVTYEISFEFPLFYRIGKKNANSEEKGFITIDLKNHPNNKKLVELIDYDNDDCDVSIELYGRQYDKNFYVKSILPNGNGKLNREEFFFFLSKLGIEHIIPESDRDKHITSTPEKHYLLFYRLFHDNYPDYIQRHIEDHIGDWEYRNDIKRFIFTDWNRHDLTLPSAEEARKILDEEVYGMQEVKERILEFLEGIRRSGNLAKNLLLVGPPGTGKTTIIQVIARILGLPMSIVPMSSCSDLDSLVGFARTYSGAQEGFVTTAMLSPLFENPDGTVETLHQFSQVLFLNEIDKLSSGNHGNPQTIILRMADDNRQFFDVYHQVLFDLSNVVIIADANDVSEISNPVLDRFDVVNIRPYSKVEKEHIFCEYVFPKVLKTQNVNKSELSVTKEAVSLIVSSSSTDGIRELKKIAERIVGNYLLHYQKRRSTVRYTCDMVKAFLPKPETYRIQLERKPGSVGSVVFSNNLVTGVSIQCRVEKAEKWSFHLYGTSDSTLKQELEAAALCASNYLSDNNYDVKIQIYPYVDDGATQALGFPVFVAVLSAAYNRHMDGMYYGGTSLLGGLTGCICDSPDRVIAYAEAAGVDTIYTAPGFSERIENAHNTRIVEFLDADVAYKLLFKLPNT